MFQALNRALKFKQITVKQHLHQWIQRVILGLYNVLDLVVTLDVAEDGNGNAYCKEDDHHHNDVEPFTWDKQLVS